MKIPYPILSGFAAGALLVGLWNFNNHLVRTMVRRDAIKHNAGHYEANPTNGTVTFVWHSCPPQ